MNVSAIDPMLFYFNLNIRPQASARILMTKPYDKRKYIAKPKNEIVKHTHRERETITSLSSSLAAKLSIYRFKTVRTE